MGMNQYVPEKRETRRNFCIRLNDDEMRKVTDIMYACDIPDFSKCIRFLIQQGHDSLDSSKAVNHD